MPHYQYFLTNDNYAKTVDSFMLLVSIAEVENWLSIARS
jgi:hypothetical protein